MLTNIFVIARRFKFANKLGSWIPLDNFIIMGILKYLTKIVYDQSRGQQAFNAMSYPFMKEINTETFLRIVIS